MIFSSKNVEWLAYVHRYEQSKVVFVNSITDNLSLHLYCNLVGLIIFIAFQAAQVLNL